MDENVKFEFNLKSKDPRLSFSLELKNGKIVYKGLDEQGKDLTVDFEIEKDEWKQMRGYLVPAILQTRKSQPERYEDTGYFWTLKASGEIVSLREEGYINNEETLHSILEQVKKALEIMEAGLPKHSSNAKAIPILLKQAALFTK